MQYGHFIIFTHHSPTIYTTNEIMPFNNTGELNWGNKCLFDLFNFQTWRTESFFNLSCFLRKRSENLDKMPIKFHPEMIMTKILMTFTYHSIWHDLLRLEPDGHGVWLLLHNAEKGEVWEVAMVVLVRFKSSVELFNFSQNILVFITDCLINRNIIFIVIFFTC